MIFNKLAKDCYPNAIHARPYFIYLRKVAGQISEALLLTDSPQESNRVFKFILNFALAHLDLTVYVSASSLVFD